jgi:hypothetical protein
VFCYSNFTLFNFFNFLKANCNFIKRLIINSIFKKVNLKSQAQTEYKANFTKPFAVLNMHGRGQNPEDQSKSNYHELVNCI